MSNKEIKFSNKYWQEVDEMEEFSLKIDFYNMLFTNINIDELEATTKADKFYWDNRNKHIYADPKKYLDTIKKAVKADAENTGEEYDEYLAYNIYNDFIDDYGRETDQIENYFQLYEKYRQNLEILATHKLFLKILLQNENITYKEDIDLLNIYIALIQNYVEVQVIMLIQEVMIEYFKVDYEVNYPLNPFIDLIDDFNIFLNRQGYKIKLDKKLELPKEKTKKFIKEKINLYQNPQKQINQVIEYSSISVGIEGINEE